MINLRPQDQNVWDRDQDLWDRGRDRDQLLWDRDQERDRDQKCGLETMLVSLFRDLNIPAFEY